jgi:hypothetical protein
MDGKLRDVRGFSNDQNKGPDSAMVLGVPLLELKGPDEVRTRLYQPLEALIADAVATSGSAGAAASRDSAPE